MSDKVYCYAPDYTVLKNIPGYRDKADLEAFERGAVLERMIEGPPRGNFDLAHLQAIHKHLFQDVYEWAGDIRETSLSKGGHTFMSQSRIGTAMSDIHARLKAQNYLKELSAPDFAKAAGQILGDVNYTHPFREGNGRTQFQYLKQLGAQAGHDIDLTRFEQRSWYAASRAANDANYEPMAECIAKAIGPDRSPQRLDPRAEKLLERYRDLIEEQPERDASHERDRDDRER